jgi:AAA domain
MLMPNDVLTPVGEVPLVSTGSWTVAKVRHLLDRNSIKYRETPSDRTTHDEGIQFNLAVCTLCGQSEGNPAIWVNNGTLCFKCFWEPPCDGPGPKKTATDFLKALPKQPEDARPEPPIQRVSEMIETCRKPSSVIHGVLRQRDTMNVIGDSKGHKSSFAEQAAVCVAAGKEFLQFKTNKGRVLLIDNEVQQSDLVERLTAIAKKLGLEWQEVDENLDVLSLREHDYNIDQLTDRISRISKGKYDLMVVDALYQIYPDRYDENSNADVTRMYRKLKRMAAEQDCGILVVHHTAKGRQFDKKTSDVGAGAGAQSRAADTHVVLINHEEKNTVVMDAIVRFALPPAPVCLVFDWPIWTVHPEKNVHKIALTNKEHITLDKFMERVPLEPVRKTEWLDSVRKDLGLQKASLNALIHEAKAANLIIEEPQKGSSHAIMIRRVAAPKKSSKSKVNSFDSGDENLLSNSQQIQIAEDERYLGEAEVNCFGGDKWTPSSNSDQLLDDSVATELFVHHCKSFDDLVELMDAPGDGDLHFIIA